MSLMDATEGGALGGALIARWRERLAEEYRAGDEAIRDCLINATLAPAFTRPDIRRVFEVWEQDEVLRDAYAKAARGRNPPSVR